MGGAADKLDAAVAHDFQGLVDRENEFQLHIQAFVFEEPKLHRGGSGEIGG